MAEPEAIGQPIKMSQEQQPQGFVGEVKIEGETVFTISPQMLMDDNLPPKERKTRWGELKIRKQRVQEDVVFNPLEALVSGNSLMAITQYGQSDLQLKMSIFGDPSSRRKSKWHHDIEKTFTPPMLDYISPEVGLDELEYLIRLYRLDELTFRMADFQPDDPDVRSPSPPPIYDRNGKLTNTREVRKREALLKEKVQLIEDCMKMRKTFAPPADYRPLRKIKRIYLTDSAINDSSANYLGKIIGYKGATQKRIQQLTGCSISLRGKGITSAHKDVAEDYERPHVLITADTDDQIDQATEEIKKILNGEEDNPTNLEDGIIDITRGMFDKGYCENCDETSHRTWECPHAPNIKHTVKCSICGQISHPTSDCPQKAEYMKAQQTEQINRLMESQYEKFKGTMGEKPKESGLAFITDYSKKDLLKIEGEKGVPSVMVPPPVPLGGFTLPLPVTEAALPQFDKKPTLPNFTLPKFQQEKKKEDPK